MRDALRAGLKAQPPLSKGPSWNSRKKGPEREARLQGETARQEEVQAAWVLAELPSQRR